MIPKPFHSLLSLAPFILLSCDKAPRESPPAKETTAAQKRNGAAAVVLEPYSSEERFLSTYPSRIAESYRYGAPELLTDRSILPAAIAETLHEEDELRLVTVHKFDTWTPPAPSEGNCFCVHNLSQKRILVYGNASYTEAFESLYEKHKNDGYQHLTLHFKLYEHPLLSEPPKVWQPSQLQSALLLSTQSLRCLTGYASTLKWAEKNKLEVKVEHLKKDSCYQLTDSTLSLQLPAKKINIQRSVNCLINTTEPLVMEVGRHSDSHYLLALEVSESDSTQTPIAQPSF